LAEAINKTLIFLEPDWLQEEGLYSFSQKEAHKAFSSQNHQKEGFWLWFQEGLVGSWNMAETAAK
jgi:hypothetical protein